MMTMCKSNILTWFGHKELVFVLCLTLLFSDISGQDVQQTPAVGKKAVTKCYDDFNRPQRCIPEFENAAYGVVMESTNTCGDMGPIEFCVQTGSSNRKSCEMCQENEHPAYYLTDLHDHENITWWQSETMYEGVQYPSQVNLTLNLRKAFDITYVRLWFYSPRPESFAIYKRTKEDGPWLPYQFYSATCRDTYALPDSAHTNRGEETRALCKSEYSDISPLRGGNVAFSTLEGRPSAYSFDTSPELQEWVTATDIRITLDRLNTFGDEVFGDPQVLRSYFYAIADVAVGARCKCHGHASECVSSTGLDGQRSRVCRCEHNTAGPDCGECLPFYNDAPWGRASSLNAHECKACNCNGFSNRCFFDKTLYESTGHGGHCLDCTANRDGPNCERCKENFFQLENHYCVACNCDPTGSRSLQCNSKGECQCKPGVTGDKCDRCDINYYDFGAQGCKSCGCSEAGALDNAPECDTTTGVCRCKEHVEGRRCRECKPGYFNLDLENKFGCTPCFCYGHASECQSAPGYSRVTMESMFARGHERWTAMDDYRRNIPLQYNGITQNIGVSSQQGEKVYFLAPDRFLGDQRASYNHELKFTLRVGESGPAPLSDDVVLEGAGTQVSLPIFAQGNVFPSIHPQEFKFVLHENPNFGWQPRLSAQAFMSILSNLTAIKIRGTYSPQGVGFLDDVKLETAQRGAAGQPALWIETCRCPSAYVGQHCESCAPGFRHSPSRGGPFSPCVPCECNGHAAICDSDSGRCICQHNTAGDNCELCARGYYGNALSGSAYDCKLCPCPNNGACMQLPDETVVCLECPAGYAGPRCDLCSDGYYGDPTGRFGPIQSCLACDCNGNVDLNAVGNCNRTSGSCLKCIHYTAGDHCDQCLPGYYGDALAEPKGDCRRCSCNPYGTQETEDGPPRCDQITGRCFCKSHVQGSNCDQCEPGYYNLVSGEGCDSCQCDPTGSVGNTCDQFTGQCICQPGVTGKHCDQCAAYQFGFSSAGCKQCACDPIGSQGLQCDASSGQCPCNDNVEGRSCDRCKENKHDRKRGCVDCPACYNLVQVAANKHRKELSDMQRVLDEIANKPTVINDADFDTKLKEVQERVTELAAAAKRGAGGGDKSLVERLGELRARLDSVNKLLSEVDELALEGQAGDEQGTKNVTRAKETIEAARAELNNALDFLNTEGLAALQRATVRSELFGQQSDTMTEIAQEARALADALQGVAENVAIVAEQARNVSKEAHDTASSAINKQKSITDEAHQLNAELYNAEQKLKTVKDAVEEAETMANNTHEEALTLYTLVDTQYIPDVDAGKLKEEAQYIARESTRIRNETETLVDVNADLISDLEDEIDRGQRLLEDANLVQSDIDAMLAEVDLAHAKAKESVELGDKTLKDAQETLTTLSGFHEQVQSSKSLADDALKTVPDIERMIQEAQNKTYSAELSLYGAESNANNAKLTAQNAQEKYAQQASKDADVIRRDANTTKLEALKHRDEADSLAGRVAATGQRLDRLEGKAQGEALLTKEAKAEVGKAKTDAAEASKQVDKAMAEVQFIIDELENLQDINENDLESLTRRLEAAEDELRTADLDARMATLSAARTQQAYWMREHEAEVAKLREEVEGVQAIAEALPQGCFKRTRLEP